MSKRKKTRAQLRKNRGERVRRDDWTWRFVARDERLEDVAREERVSGKGELTRKRTIALAELEEGGAGEAGSAGLMRGRVISVRGLHSEVEDGQGRIYRCATRRVLRSLESVDRHAVVVGDFVGFRPEGGLQGWIERIEPRKGMISRTSKGRRHLMVANVDQVLVVTSASEPPLKPNLVDRYLVSAEQARLCPVICINKVDLIELADLQPLVGVYAQMGYEVLQVSALSGFGLAGLRRVLTGRTTMIAGQSGVGKSSLLNAVDPSFRLKVQSVSTDSHKGRHTTTTARLMPFPGGGYVVDTPGIRQFQLWDTVPIEVASLFRDLRPFANFCHFPNCTHTHEQNCAVKNAVADGYIDARRYESYCHMIDGE